MNYNNIPLELRQCPHWINWRYQEISKSKKPTKVPLRSCDGYLAAANNVNDFATFDDAVRSSQYCDGIGFVFTKADPFVGIDLDGGEIEESERIRQQQIYQEFASYSEISPSGTGLHIICKGQLFGPGRRRKSIEIYDNLRFFTFTGKRINEWGCEYRQAAIDKLYKEFGIVPVPATHIDEPQEKSDLEVWQAASSAANGDKFLRLYNGDWKTDYGKLSQSEADLALINMIAFYSRNREQIARIFRCSGLGQREKAQRNDYLAWMTSKAFDRQPPPADLDLLRNQRTALLASLGLPE